ncbi:MAG: hypothetical protein KAT85_05515, partial [candidate division Zixibacteria bacterium]|nr:hypothetical protein [candidate division Zixibacteria bacterium]
MKNGTILLTIGLFLLLAGSAMASGIGDVTIHLNGGDDVVYIGDTNIVEFWIKNDVKLQAMSLGFIFTIGRNYAFDPAHGASGYVKEEGDAVGAWNLGGLLETPYINNVSPDSILFGGAAMPPAGLPAHANLTLCYTMAVYILPGQAPLAGGFCVDTTFIPPAGEWLFFEEGGFTYPPEFQGGAGGPVCFDIVIPSLTIVPTPPGFTYVANVPDWNQPPFSGATNYCAPVAALNIVDYWQSGL